MTLYFLLVFISIAFTFTPHINGFYLPPRYPSNFNAKIRSIKMKFELVEFSIPIQLDTSNYENIVIHKCNEMNSELIRWSITHTDKNSSKAIIEAVIYKS